MILGPSVHKFLAEHGIEPNTRVYRRLNATLQKDYDQRWPRAVTSPDGTMSFTVFFYYIFSQRLFELTIRSHRASLRLFEADQSVFRDKKDSPLLFLKNRRATIQERADIAFQLVAREKADNVPVLNSLATYGRVPPGLGGIDEPYYFSSGLKTFISGSLQRIHPRLFQTMNKKESNNFYRGLLLAIQQDFQIEKFKALRAVCRAIPRPIRQALRASGSFNLHMLNFLLADGNEKKQKHRCQAVMAYPIMMGLLVRDFITTDQPIYATSVVSFSNQLTSRSESAFAKLVQAIDESNGSLERHLSYCPLDGTTCLDPVQIRALSHIRSWPPDPKIDAQNKVFLLSLKAIDPNWLPKTSEQLSDFFVFAQKAKILSDITGLPFEELIKLPRGRWAEYSEKFGPIKNVQDVGDWLEDVFKLVIIPALIENHPNINNPTFFDPHKSLKAVHAFEAAKGALKAAFCSAYHPVMLLKLANNWHDAGGDPEEIKLRREARAALSLSAQRTWPALIQETYTASNGISVKALTSHDDLKEAGYALLHCVGDSSIYWARCVQGLSHIVGLYDQNGTLLTTAEISERRDDRSNVELKPVQHQGYSRRDPTDHEVTALAEYLAAIAQDPRWAPDWDRIGIERGKAQARVKTEQRTDNISNYVGYRVFDPSEQPRMYRTKEALALGARFLPVSDRANTSEKIWERIKDIAMAMDLPAPWNN